jgi:hypothetical protein
MAIPFSTTATMELLSIGLVLLVHVLGGAALIYLLVRDSGENVRDWWPSDDDDGGPPLLGPDDTNPRGGGGALPLPGAGPSSVRVREGERIAETYPRPARRPAREPERTPTRPPAGRP